MPSPDVSQAARLVQAGNFAEAERICRRLLKRNRKDVQALQLLASTAFARGDYAGAAEGYGKCVRMRPDAAGLHFARGKACMMIGRYDAALAAFDRALELKPGDRVATGWKAGLLERRGEYGAARALLRPLLDGDDADADTAELMARLENHLGDHRAAVETARRFVDDPKTTPGQRALLHYAMGRAWERLGEYDRSFEAFRRANEDAPAPPFDAGTHVRFVDDLIEAFSSRRMPSLPRSRQRSELPVFIAGMPRSGTTLVEQIIDAHPQAHGAGELEEIEQAAAGLQMELGAYDPYPACVEELTEPAARRLAAAYLSGLARRGGRATRVVNKSLENYKHLGLIALLLPGARVIHCRRHPLDTCLSCYMGGILPARAPWVTDLDSLGLVYRQYERLMDHWTRVLDLPRLEVVYEDVVDDLEGQSRRIIDFLGLDWDDRCLRYYESGRPVLTLSYAQVTRPIYRSAVGRYRHYQRHLGPLKAVLGLT